MEPKTLMSADYLDIIFDNRNKTYGSYELRRNYNRRLKKATGIMLLGIIAALSVSFVAVRHTTIDIKPHITPTVMTEIITVVPPLVIPKVIPPALPPPPHHLNTSIFTVPKIVENIQVPDDKQMTQNKDLHDTQPGVTDATGDQTGIDAGNAKGNGTSVVTVTDNNSNVPRVWVEQMPQFPGDMNTYLSNHLYYPAVASNEGITGKVIVEFVVNEDGAVSDVKVLRGIGGGCDEEAARVVSNMPAWKPGKQNGKAVKVLFRLPITFLLK